jgi:hypothetical protein
MTPEQAEEIFYAHDVGLVLEDRDEVAALERHNPLLLEAYRALLKLADLA